MFELALEPPFDFMEVSRRLPTDAGPRLSVVFEALCSEQAGSHRAGGSSVMLLIVLLIKR